MQLAQDEIRRARGCFSPAGRPSRRYGRESGCHTGRRCGVAGGVGGKGELLPLGKGLEAKPEHERERLLDGVEFGAGEVTEAADDRLHVEDA